jgi:hypothetical protein
MAVEIQELEVVPSEAAPAAVPSPPQPAAPRPALELELERAARLLWSRDLRLQAD